MAWATFGKVLNPPEGIETVSVAPEWPGREVTFAKLAQLGAIRKLRSLLRERRPDLVHAHFISSAGLLGALAGARPLAVTVHGSDLIGTARVLRTLVGRYVASRAALINPVSTPLEEALRAQSVPSGKLLRATLGVEVDKIPFRPAKPLEEAPRLLCTRALEDVYDPWTLISALGQLREAGLAARLTFAAGGSLEPALKRRVQQHGLAESVAFMSGFSPQDLSALLSSHDLYVSASLSDGTSLSLLEAMAGGIFPVASDIAANQSWIEDGHTGRLFEPGSPDALAGAIRLAWSDEDRDRAVAANRAFVERDGDRRLNFERLEERFQELVEG